MKVQPKTPKWLPARIVALRKRFGDTHDAFAARLGVNLRSLYRWESGASKPSRLAVRLLEELDKR
jgi:DNA-binding transcriptional regulator YiaG